MLLSFFSSSPFSRWQVIIWIACAPVALVLCSADPCCESLLHQHEARRQSPGGISIPTCYLLPSRKTRCSEMLDLVYEAVAVSSSLTLLRNITAKLPAYCSHMQGTHELPPQRARKSHLLCTIQQILVLLFPSLLVFFSHQWAFILMPWGPTKLVVHHPEQQTGIWILFSRVYKLLIWGAKAEREIHWSVQAAASSEEKSREPQVKALDIKPSFSSSLLRITLQRLK